MRTRYVQSGADWIPEYAAQSRGLGDLIARGLYRYGIRQRPGCPCPKRQSWLNRAVPFRPPPRRRARPIGGGSGQEETVCADAAVFFCDNFEDRAVGTASLLLDPGLSKSSAWDMSATNSNVSVSTAEAFSGTKSMQFAYPVCAIGDGGDQCSASYGSIAFNRPEIYQRHYVKWSTGWYWSPIATKHIGFDGFSPLFGNNQRRPFAWHEYFNFSQAASLTMSDTGYDPPHDYAQNANGAPIVFAGGTWYCLEIHLKRNGATSLFEGWVDGVLKWNYPTSDINADSGGNWLDMEVSGYWNHNVGDPSGVRGTQERYFDNIVLSTARIGCLGAQPAPAASPPPRIGIYA